MVYYYNLRGSSQTLATQITPTASFHTPKVIDITTSSPVSSTGAIVLSGVLATGSTVFQGTGVLSLPSEENPNDIISLSLSGLIITTAGTGQWDGVLSSPRTTVLTGVVLSETGYTLTGSVYKAGNDAVSLVLSGQVASLQIYVGTTLNGRTLHVYRSETGGVFDPIDTCIVSSDVCQFQTDHFSYFAFAAPTDTTPNAFTFASKTNAELSTNSDSDPITVSGINTAATISIIGGSYSINNTAYTSTAGTVSNGDVVKIRVVSSASYNTATQATLTIGGVSASFSITTKAAPVVASGGGGGGGG